jgi:hypothetical protein
MVQEQVGLKWLVGHPRGSCRHQASQRRDDLLNIVVGRIRVYHHAIVAAALVKIRFLKEADLNRGVHQAVVVLRREGVALRREGVAPRRKRGRNTPPRKQIGEPDLGR